MHYYSIHETIMLTSNTHEVVNEIPQYFIDQCKDVDIRIEGNEFTLNL